MKTALLRVTALLCFSVFFVSQAHANLPPPNLADLVEKAMPSVVNISSTTIVNYQVYGMDDFLRMWGIPQERKQSSLGSGFILDTDGYVMTNCHVIDQADEVYVTLADKRTFRAKIIGKDKKLDVALLQLRDKQRQVPKNLIPVSVGDSDHARIGDGVFAVGNPFGLQNTVTSGIISAKNRTVGAGPLDNFIQTDASINPGNSGGALFNLKGEIIGINTMIFSTTRQSAGIGFAIPIKQAMAVVPELKRYGRVPRPWLGLVAERITPGLAAHYRLPVDEGALVYNLVEGAPADDVGMKRGDIIVSVDGEKITEPFEVERALAKKHPGEKLTLKVQRLNRVLELKIPLQEIPARLIDRLPEGLI